jgi:hypothetical protein
MSGSNPVTAPDPGVLAAPIIAAPPGTLVPPQRRRAGQSPPARLHVDPAPPVPEDSTSKLTAEALPLKEVT